MKVERYKCGKKYTQLDVIIIIIIFMIVYTLIFMILKGEKEMLLNIKNIAKDEVEFIRKLEIKKGDILVFKTKIMSDNPDFMHQDFNGKIAEIAGLSYNDFLLIIIQEDNDLYKIDKEILLNMLELTEERKNYLR